MQAPAGPTAVDEDRYTDFYAGQAQSPTLRAVYREAYGADYPEELDPFGFVTRADLARIAELVAVAPGGLLADLGCGRGGPGMWVARTVGARLVGVDVVAGAVLDAARRSAAFGPAGARFGVGSFVDTGLAEGSCAAVMSVDALWMVWDKRAALAEVARVLAPGARFVFTTWEPAAVDHVALLAEAGFEVLVREETPRWLERQRAVYDGIVAASDALRAELGEQGAAVLLAEARETPEVLAGTPRVLMAARTPGHAR